MELICKTNTLKVKELIDILKNYENCDVTICGELGVQIVKERDYITFDSPSYYFDDVDYEEGE